MCSRLLLTSTLTFPSAQNFQADYFWPYGIWDQDQTHLRQMPRSQSATVPGVLGNTREKTCQGLLFSNAFHFSNNLNLPRGNRDNQVLCQKSPSSSGSCILSLACCSGMQKEAIREGRRFKWAGQKLSMHLSTSSGPFVTFRAPLCFRSQSLNTGCTHHFPDAPGTYAAENYLQ